MSVAASLPPAARKSLAIEVLSKAEPVTHLAIQHQVSRKFLYQRRQLGPQYLDLLRFFLNHRTFIRSECPERVGKSPKQLMTAQPHAHWLELLGFERFQRA